MTAATSVFLEVPADEAYRGRQACVRHLGRILDPDPPDDSSPRGLVCDAFRPGDDRSCDWETVHKDTWKRLAGKS
jgi:hypothetical protein